MKNFINNLMKTACIFVMLNFVCIAATTKILNGTLNETVNEASKKTLKEKVGQESKKVSYLPINKKEKSMKIEEYKVKGELKSLGLSGISDDQINDHWKLYEGYVKQVNALNAELQKLAQDGQANELIFADRRRRYGFEYNGMILHEYYFENLNSKGKKLPEGEKLSVGGELSTSGKLSDKNLKKAIEETWGSFDAWKEDFIATGKTRGIGWAILYMDPQTKRLTNNFVAEHQDGIISGFKPILVMDVWEHAYMIDQSATDRAKYIDAFLQNVDWAVLESRFSK